MDIYSLLDEIVLAEKYALNASLYKEEDKEKLESDEDKKIYEIVKNVSSLWIEITDAGITFHSRKVWGDKRAFVIEDMSESDYEILEKMQLDKVPLNLRVRIADILWTKRKNYQAALVAAESYLDVFRLWFSEDDWVETLNMIKRAIYISAQIKNDEIYEKACRTVYDQILQFNGSDGGFLSLRLLDILVEQKYGNVQDILSVVDNIIDRYYDDVSKVEQAYEIEIGCYNNLKDKQSATNAKIRLADYYVEYANKVVGSNMQNAMRAERFLQKAIFIYRNNGETKKGEKIHKRLVELQKTIPKLMTSISTEIDVSDLNKTIELNLEGLSFEESILRLAQMIPFYKKEDVRKRVIEEHRKYPLSHLFGKSLINASGQTILSLRPLDLSNPESDTGLLDMHINQKLLDDGRIAGDLCVKYALYRIRKQYEITPNDLDFLIMDNPIIPEGREKIFRSALFMILCGQYYEAMHILAPQVENLFRNIAKEVGGITVTLENDGSSKEKVLKSIFDLPELLDCYDNDILFLFKALLNEQSGANIRNEIAHGIVSETSASTGVYLFFAGAVIKLLSYTSLRCYEIIWC